MSEFLMQMRPWFGEEEKQAVCNYMDEDGFLTEFKHTEEFEKLIAAYVGAKHCIVVNNGTVSLTLAALAAGVGYEDEVLVPNYTMIATPNSVKMIGAKPVFVDVEPDTLCMNYSLAEKAITPQTKAIILVTANGRYPASGIEKFKSLAERNNIVLIEDAAQSLGSYFPSGEHMGTVGSLGSFSFSAPKIISTGQGGAIITNDDALAKKVRKLKDFGRSAGGNDIHDTIGYNFKFTELQAVVGIQQMKKLEHRVVRKKEIFSLYQELLDNVSQIRFFSQDLKCTVPWFIDVKAENRSELQEYLKEKNIGTRVMYPPINRQQAYQFSGDFPVSRIVGEQGLWLPSMTQLTNADVERIAIEVKAFYS